MPTNETMDLLDNNTTESSMNDSEIIAAKSKSARFLGEVLLLFGGAVLVYFTSTLIFFIIPLIFRDNSIENVWITAIPTTIVAGAFIYGMRFWRSIKTLKVGKMGKTLLRVAIFGVLIGAYAVMVYYATK